MLGDVDRAEENSVFRKIFDELQEVLLFLKRETFVSHEEPPF